MQSLQTNRDLYKAVAALLKEQADSDIPLHDYLTALYFNAQKYKSQPSISLEQFVELLRASFVRVSATPPAAPHYDKTRTGYDAWSDTILRQIKDMQDMNRKGKLGDLLNYLGVTVPSGQYWYNFDPCGYIECGMAGSFGGWREEDDTGRMFVPGEVAVSDAKGNLSFHDPRSLPDDTCPLASISWDDFRQFLWNGQSYE